MSRLFTFGCSFTRFVYPTWADILGREFDFFENWGKPGGGNQYIFNSLIECNKRNKFTKDDVIIIVWSTTLREDRYIKSKGGWVGSGNIYWSNLYPSSWVKEFVCERGSLIRDLAVIASAIDLLNYWQVRHAVSSILPIHLPDDDISELYKSTLDYLKPNMLDTVLLDHNRPSRDFFNIEIKPTKHQLNDLKDSYNQCKGVSWPSFNTFYNKKYIDPAINEEIKQDFLYDMLYNITHKDADHPSPAEHLKYIDYVFPDFKISENTINWVNNFKYGDTFEQYLPRRL